MKVSSIRRNVISAYSLRGHVGMLVEFSADTTLPDVGGPFLCDKIVDICSRPRYVVLQGDDPLRQDKAELYNLCNMFSVWHAKRSLEKVLVVTKRLSGITMFNDSRFSSFIDTEIHLEDPSKLLSSLVANLPDFRHRFVFPLSTYKSAISALDSCGFKGSVVFNNVTSELDVDNVLDYQLDRIDISIDR